MNYPNDPLLFKLSVVKPEPYTLKVKWVLNGNTIPGNDTTILLTGAQLSNGANVLKAFVTDTTSLSRSYWPDAGYQFSATWNINKSSTGIFEVNNQQDNSKFFYKLYPSPATDHISLDYNNKTNDNKADYTILDMAGRVVQSGSLQLSGGRSVAQVNLSNIASGNYLLSVKSNNINVEAKFIKQ